MFVHPLQLLSGDTIDCVGAIAYRSEKLVGSEKVSGVKASSLFSYQRNEPMISSKAVPWHSKLGVVMILLFMEQCFDAPAKIDRSFQSFYRESKLIYRVFIVGF